MTKDERTDLARERFETSLVKASRSDSAGRPSSREAAPVRRPDRRSETDLDVKRKIDERIRATAYLERIRGRGETRGSAKC